MEFHYKKFGFVIFLLLQTVYITPVHADFNSAMAAHGRGDYKTALTQFSALAQNRNAKAMFNIAYMIEKGQGVPQNPKLAIRWYTRSWQYKNSNAPFNIALIYYEGRGVKQDYVLSMEWYKKAAAMGNSAALVNIGQMHYFGKGMKKKNRVAAYAWYSLAANRGKRKALRNRDIVARQLAPISMNNAEALYRSLRAKYLDPFLE